MSNNEKINVIAADVMTGTILDENLEWFIGKPEQIKWTKLFSNHAEAIEFCEREVQAHPNVEYWLYDRPNNIEQRIVNQKWKR